MAKVVQNDVFYRLLIKCVEKIFLKGTDYITMKLCSSCFLLLRISQDPPAITAPNQIDAAEPDLEIFEPQGAGSSSSDSDRVSIGFAHGDFSFQRKIIFLVFTFFTLYSLYTFTSKTELPDHKYLQLL